MDDTFMESENWLPSTGWIKEVPNCRGSMAAACLRERQVLDNLCIWYTPRGSLPIDNTESLISKTLNMESEHWLKEHTWQRLWAAWSGFSLPKDMFLQEQGKE